MLKLVVDDDEGGGNVGCVARDRISRGGGGGRLRQTMDVIITTRIATMMVVISGR